MSNPVKAPKEDNGRRNDARDAEERGIPGQAPRPTAARNAMSTAAKPQPHGSRRASG